MGLGLFSANLDNDLMDFTKDDGTCEVGGTIVSPIPTEEEIEEVIANLTVKITSRAKLIIRMALTELLKNLDDLEGFVGEDDVCRVGLDTIPTRDEIDFLIDTF
jgi:hypothetical protein